MTSKTSIFLSSYFVLMVSLFSGNITLNSNFHMKLHPLKRPKDFCLPSTIFDSTIKIAKLKKTEWKSFIEKTDASKRTAVSSNLYVLGVCLCNGLHGVKLDVSQGLNCLLKALSLHGTTGSTNASLYVYQNRELFKTLFPGCLQGIKKPVDSEFENVSSLDGCSYLWQKNYEAVNDETLVVVSFYLRQPGESRYKMENKKFDYFGIDFYNYLEELCRKYKAKYHEDFFAFVYFPSSASTDSLRLLNVFLQKGLDCDRFGAVLLKNFEQFPQNITYLPSNRILLTFQDKGRVVFLIPARPPFLKDVGKLLTIEDLLKLIKKKCSKENEVQRDKENATKNATNN